MESLVIKAPLANHVRTFSIASFWANFVIRETRKVPAFVGVTVGFLPISERLHDSDFILSDVYQFGWIFSAAILFEGSEEESHVEEFRTIDDRSFPLLYIPVRREQHALPNLSNATSTCWAKSQKQHIRGQQGFLTAKHAVQGCTRGTQFTLNDGSIGTLADFGECGVDVALISKNGSIPKNAKALSIVDHPINGDDAYFDGDVSGRVIGQIANSWYFSDCLSAYNSMRVYLDFFGEEGDSGALVRDTNTSGGLAIYTGMVTGNGKDLGECQYLKQAIQNLDVSISL